tara:strand:+ start:434 stop:1315 length:882 start_codon:yes stop_codon:yes gene_type:complete
MGKNKLDQFYTNDDVVVACLGQLNLEDYAVIIEPSAGSGAFLAHLPARTMALDLEPAADNIHQQDYLMFVELLQASQLTCTGDKKYLVVGNPPFGKNSSLARKFFNASAQFADTIAFILPRTFRKPSTINQLNEYFHLANEILLEEYSFHLPDGSAHDVPCVFQIWERRDESRKKIPTLSTCTDFEFVDIKKTKDAAPSEAAKRMQRKSANLCIRRVGSAAGTIFDDYHSVERDWKSHYYLKTKDPDVRDVLASISWDDKSGKYDTAGNPSISKNDLIRNYYKTKKSLRKETK